MRERTITKRVRSYDSRLFCKKVDGVFHIYRRANDYNRTSHYIFSLTHNWSLHGEPCDWGLDPIVNRLKACDLWNSGMGLDDMFEHNEKVDASAHREFRNTTESYLRDFRRAFAKSTDSVNTSTLQKIDKRRIDDAFSKSR